MHLQRTRQLIHKELDTAQPVNGLKHILEAALELVSLPDNDFCWSHWETAEDAKDQIACMIRLLDSGRLPDRMDVTVLFAPTGPLQEVSISSGWGEPFLIVAGKFDVIEKLVWQRG